MRTQKRTQNVVYFDVFSDPHERKKLKISMISGWHGSPLTPETGVQLPVGLPVNKKRSCILLATPFFFYKNFISNLENENHTPDTSFLER